MQMFPVKLRCGQRWGLHITATTATPEAVRIGFALNFGRRSWRWGTGTADIMSTSFGWFERPYFFAKSDLNLNLHET